jgi:hypothetical protein
LAGPKIGDASFCSLAQRINPPTVRINRINDPMPRLSPMGLFHVEVRSLFEFKSRILHLDIWRRNHNRRAKCSLDRLRRLGSRLLLHRRFCNSHISDDDLRNGSQSHSHTLNERIHQYH